MSIKKNSFPKTDVRYWEGKVGFHTSASRTYSVQIQHANRRARINLRTANKAQAALLARKLYLELCANGWEETMRRRRGEPEFKKVNVTIGEYIEAAAAKSLVSPKTLTSYAQALRKIAGDIAGETKRERAMPSDCARSRQRRSKRGGLSSSGRKQPTPEREERPDLSEQLHPTGACALQR